ncbi:MAG: DUF5666 domain-containing protein [Burkholderiales bacterium]
MKYLIKYNAKYFQALVLAMVLGGCGGGGTQVADVGTSGTGIASSGTISAFGSVYVNGVKFKTSNATKISDDDASIGEDKLKIGQVVEIKGTSQDSLNGTADSIAVMKELKGPVDKLHDTAAKTLGVMGQPVIVDDKTLIDSNIGLPANLKLNDIVEVNGYREAAGIRATRIERQDAAARQFKASGNIGAIVNATSFTIGNLTVNYPGVVVKNLPAGGLVAGLLVQIRSAAAPVNNVITATSIEVKKGLEANSGDKGEVEGQIANFDSNCKFDVNGQAVDACGNVSFEPSGSKADLANGKRIEAEGTVSNSVLIASKIEFKSSGGSGGGGFTTEVRANAAIQSLSQTDRTITLLNKTFKVSATTQFEDKLGIARTFNIDNFATAVLHPGDVVDIRGFADASGVLNAVQVERNNSNDVIIQGKLEQNIATQLTIQGVQVQVGINTQFKNASGASITRSQFNADASIGAKVKAKGINTGASDNRVDATSGEVEIET